MGSGFLRLVERSRNRGDFGGVFNSRVVVFLAGFSLQQACRMLEDFAISMISKYLGEFIKDIEKNDLRLSLWKGDVKWTKLVCCARRS